MATHITFEEELRKLINKFSLETESNTPDFILANYVSKCLDTFNDTIKSRDLWFGFKPFDNFPESVTKIKLG